MVQEEGFRGSVLDEIFAHLTNGEITRIGLFETGQNYTFLVWIENDAGEERLGIYKPYRGEAPLGDFPWGTLYKREIASYLVSEALGWGFIPPTAIRDGPYGIGSVQLFIEHNPEENYFTLRDSYAKEFQKICVFDFITNNADRKGGHCLKGIDGRIWGIDHGLTFNVSEKLRTVIWDFSGTPIESNLRGDLERLDFRIATEPELLRSLQECLSLEEIRAFRSRVRRMIKQSTFPELDLSGRRSWPYPLV